MIRMEFFAYRSIAKEVDEWLFDVRCVKCKHLLSVTFQEVRTGKAIPCPNCEAWFPLWDIGHIFQSLYDMATSFDRTIETSCPE